MQTNPKVMKNPKRKDFTAAAGATTVEFAFVLPVILILLFGAIDCSRAIAIKETARFAAYRAARTGTMPGASYSQVLQTALDELAALDIVEAEINISPQVITPSTDAVNVEIRIPMGDNLVVGNNWLTNHIVSTNCSMRTERVSAD